MLIEDATPGTHAGSHAEYDVVVEREVMVVVRDGCRLATDCYFPAVDGQRIDRPLPVIVHRTPYDKVAVEARWRYSEYFARRGYVAIIQDVRGAFGSDGEMEFALHDALDGADVAAWLEAQPWCNGRVGSWGTSYSSFTQLAMATQGPSILKAMVPNQSASDAWVSSIRQGGAFELRFLGWNLWHSATNTRQGALSDPELLDALNFGAPLTRDWLTRLPIRAGETQLKLSPSHERWVMKVMTESDYTEFWQQPGLAPVRYVENFPDADILLTGGWWDPYARSAFDLYSALTAAGKSVRLLVGPWVHGTGAMGQSIAGDADFGDVAALPSVKQLHLRWFDRSLKQLETGIDNDAPIRIFVMGGGSGQRTPAGHIAHGGVWRDEREWPLSRARSTDWFLHGDGTLSTEVPEIERDSTTYQFDPAHPVPSIGGNISSLADLTPLAPGTGDSDSSGGATRFREIVPAGPFNQVEHAGVFGATPPYLPLSSRRDVLTFRSGPLEAECEVTGPIEVHLWVSSSATDTDFTAKLIDEYPPSKWYPLGYSLNLTDSVVRLRYRTGGDAEFLTPDEIAQITIVLYPIANLFVAGHRIRLDVSSSNFPRFDVNPNTGGPLGVDRRRLVADNSVFHDATHPSRLVLPIVPTAGS